MAGSSDDQSIRLDQAFREVSARRSADPSLPHEPPVRPDPDAIREATDAAAGRRRAKALEADELRQVIRAELSTALAGSDLVVELSALVTAVDDLRRRVEDLADQLEEPAPLDAAGGSSSSRGLRHGLRSMSPGRPGRVR
jgi:hypothetical protein